MTKIRMRLWAFQPDHRFAIGIQGNWFDPKPPRIWGLPANDNWRE